MLLGILQLFMVVFTTDDAGCHNLLYHRVKIFEEFERNCSEEEEAEFGEHKSYWQKNKNS